MLLIIFIGAEGLMGVMCLRREVDHSFNLQWL